MRGGGDLVKKLSSTKYLVENVKNLTAGMTEKQVREELGVHPDTHRKVLNGDISTLSLTVIQRYAINSDIGISELFLHPDLVDQYTAWYRESQLYCFSKNFKDYMDVNGVKPKDVVESMGKTRNIIRGYQNGLYYPRIGDLDRIADVLGVEVADLFLP